MSIIVDKFHLFVNRTNYFLFARHKRGHGIHSPFMFDLITKVLRSGLSPKEKMKHVEKRKQLIINNQIIISGSKGAVKNLKKHSIASLARKSSTSYKYVELILKLARWSSANKILELGTCCGLTAATLADFLPHAHIYTIEGDKARCKISKKFFEEVNLTNISPVCTDFDDYLDGEKKSNNLFDLVFLDGDHTYKATMRYFEKIMAVVHENSIIIFDDIYWSKEMTRAWKEIIEDERVVYSVDLYQVGVVFLRKIGPKQHFVIRY